MASNAAADGSNNSSLSTPSSPASSAPSTPVTSMLSSPALLSTNVGTASTMVTGVPMSHVIYNISIKSLVPYTLNLESHNYSKWCTLFTMVLGRFHLMSHILDDAVHSTDIEWTKEDLLVGNWLYSTISENLMDMCLQLRSPTALTSSQATSPTARQICVRQENSSSNPNKRFNLRGSIPISYQGN
jgi:hypothetical protein